MVNRGCQQFSFLCWNVQGLGEDDKCDLVHNSIVSADPSIACLQESKLCLLSAQKARSFLPAALSAFVAKDADGSRGGVVTAWNPRLLSLTNETWSLFSLTTSLVSTVSDLAFTITNVYAPLTTPSPRRSLMI